MSLQNDYTKSHPLEICLLNEDQQNILYISNDLQSLSIEITNISDEAIQFNLPGSGQSADDFHHINVNLKPETIDTSTDPNNLFALDTSEGWGMGTINVDANNSVSVSFQLTSGLVLQPSEKTTITLSNVGASADAGSRVTQVQVFAGNMSYTSDTQNLIKFSVTTQLSIINQRGKKNIPLHFGFLGSNTVLNDGKSSSDLILQITNTASVSQLGTDLSNVNFNYDSNSNNRSSITFSFISDETGLEDALATANQIAAIEIEPPTNWKCDINDISNNTEWNLYPETETQTLASSNVLKININAIITGASTGITYLKVCYANIPGYWDGEVMVPIMKQPLVMRSVTDYDADENVINVGNQVGIGIMPTQAAQTVDGLTSTSNNLLVEGHIISQQRISDKAGPVMPVGGIIMWSGSSDNIPEGWVLCDGNNNTPNLTDRFLLGAGGNYNPGETGGNENIIIKEENLPSHNHGVTLAEDGAHNHRLLVDTGDGGDYGNPYNMCKVSGYDNYVANHRALTDDSETHSHAVTENNVGGDTAIDIRPQYFALCFIMKQ